MSIFLSLANFLASGDINIRLDSFLFEMTSDFESVFNITFSSIKFDFSLFIVVSTFLSGVFDLLK